MCSNSLKSDDPTTASGVLKRELTLLGSELIKTAYKFKVPAGSALAVDREAFSSEITKKIKENKISLRTLKKLIQLMKMQSQLLQQVR